MSTLYVAPVIVGLTHNLEPVEFQGAAANHRLGSSGVDISRTLATGDFDGDGLDDLATGFSTANVSGRNQAGLVALRYGRSSWPLLGEDEMSSTTARPPRRPSAPWWPWGMSPATAKPTC